MLVLILTLGYAAVVAKLIAAYRIHRATDRFPAVCACLAFSSIRTVLALNFSFATRQLIYSIGAPLDLALECLAIIEVYRAVTINHFPVKKWGTRFLAAFIGAGVGVSALSHYAGANPFGGWFGTAILAERYTSAAMAITLALTWAFLRLTSRIPESPMASRGVAILTAHAASSMVIVGMMVLFGLRSFWIASVIPAGNGLVVGILWATLFASARQEAEAEEPVTNHERREIERMEDEFCADLHGRRFGTAAE